MFTVYSCLRKIRLLKMSQDITQTFVIYLPGQQFSLQIFIKKKYYFSTTITIIFYYDFSGFPSKKLKKCYPFFKLLSSVET